MLVTATIWILICTNRSDIMQFMHGLARCAYNIALARVRNSLPFAIIGKRVVSDPADRQSVWLLTLARQFVSGHTFENDGFLFP